MSPDALVHLVLSDPNLRYWWFDRPDAFPTSAREYFRAACCMVASSDVPGTYQPPPGLEDEPLSSRLASGANCFGRIKEAEAAIEAMVRGGFIKLLPGNGFHLPILVRARTAAVGTTTGKSPATRKPSPSAANGRDGGRPRKGETAAQAKARRQGEANDKAARHHAAKQQEELKLPINGTPAPEGHAMPPSDPLVVGNSCAAFRVVPETKPGNLNQAVQVSGQVSGSEPCSDVAVVVSSKDFPCTTTSSVEESPRAEGSMPNLETKPEPDAEPNPEPKPKPYGNLDGQVSGKAQILAKLADDKFGWNRVQRNKAPGIFQGLLDEGHTSEQLKAAIDGEEDCNGARYFCSIPLDKLYPRKMPVPTSSGPVSVAVRGIRLHPELASRKKWTELAVPNQLAMSRILSLLDQPSSSERTRELQKQSRHAQGDFDRVAEVFPALLDVVADSTSKVTNPGGWGVAMPAGSLNAAAPGF